MAPVEETAPQLDKVVDAQRREAKGLGLIVKYLHDIVVSLL